MSRTRAPRLDDNLDSVDRSLIAFWDCAEAIRDHYGVVIATRSIRAGLKLMNAVADGLLPDTTETDDLTPEQLENLVEMARLIRSWV